MVFGLGGALLTGDLWGLAIAALGFAGLVWVLLTQSTAFEARTPKWLDRLEKGKDMATAGDWTQAMSTFAETMGMCRNERDRGRASELISDFLWRNDKLAEAEPYLRQALTFRT